jgi:hypothetical protein
VEHAAPGPGHVLRPPSGGTGVLLLPARLLPFSGLAAARHCSASATFTPFCEIHPHFRPCNHQVGELGLLQHILHTIPGIEDAGAALASMM